MKSMMILWSTFDDCSAILTSEYDISGQPCLPSLDFDEMLWIVTN